jgi:4-amino-4-deoxy-L-arabinose transferase-like glycosyltransferase
MYSSFLLPAVVLTVEVVAVAAVAVRVSARLVPDPGLSVARCTYGLLLAVAQVIGVVQLAGMLHLLTEGWVLLLQLLVAGICLRWVRPPSPLEAAQGVHRRTHHHGMKLAIGVVGVAILIAAVAVSLTRASTDSDTLSYHLPNIAFWLQQASLWHLPTSIPTFFTNAYPSNGELSALWLILPVHSDLLAFAMPCVFGVLCVLATAQLAAKLRASPWIGGLAGLAVVTSPLVIGTQVDSMLVDLTATSGVIVACACLLEAWDEPGRWQWPALAGLSLGISLGSKDTAVVAAIATLVVLVVGTRKSYRLRALGWAALGAALLAMFWYIRDWVILGNPIFPQRVTIGGRAIFSGPHSPLDRYATSLLSQFVHLRSAPIHTWLHETLVEYGPSIALAILGGVVAVAVAARRHDRRLGAITCIMWIAAVGYLATPYTGGGVKGVLFLIASQLRYLLPAVFLAVALAAAVLPRIVTGTLCAAALVYGAIKAHQLHADRPELQLTFKVIALALVAALVLTALRPLFLRRPAGGQGRALRTPSGWIGRVVVLGVIVLAGAGVMAGLRGPVQADPVGRALAAVGQPDGRALLIGGKFPSLYLGPHLRNDVYTVGAGGLDDVEAVQRSSILDQKIAETHPSVLIVSPRLAPGEPRGWSPPAGWIRFTSVHGTTIFVRLDQLLPRTSKGIGQGPNQPRG